MTVFVISDTHFSHANILDFTHHDGTPMRDFRSVEEMNLTMIENWNRVVGVNDKVYHLGDVAMSGPGLELVRMLNGKKRLVRGNHDLKPTRRYLDVGFQEIYGVRQINGAWLTHVPMHVDSVNEKRVKVNIHGHLHRNTINHPKYVNVSVEQVGYTPVALDDIMERYEDG